MMTAGKRLLLLGTLFVAHASNPFSSNVIELTPKNWRTEVEETGQAVFVNICRVG